LGPIPGFAMNTASRENCFVTEIGRRRRVVAGNSQFRDDLAEILNRIGQNFGWPDRNGDRNCSNRTQRSDRHRAASPDRGELCHQFDQDFTWIRAFPISPFRRSPGHEQSTYSRYYRPPHWGLADSAPYLHDGRADEIAEANNHHGGEALSAE